MHKDETHVPVCALNLSGYMGLHGVTWGYMGLQLYSQPDGNHVPVCALAHMKV